MNQRICLWIMLLALYLGTHNDHLAIMYYSFPVQVFPYSVSIYPKADQVLLSKGIPIDSNTALSTILEDYFS